MQHGRLQLHVPSTHHGDTHFDVPDQIRKQLEELAVERLPFRQWHVLHLQWTCMQHADQAHSLGLHRCVWSSIPCMQLAAMSTLIQWLLTAAVHAWTFLDRTQSVLWSYRVAVPPVKPSFAKVSEKRKFTEHNGSSQTRTWKRSRRHSSTRRGSDRSTFVPSSSTCTRAVSPASRDPLLGHTRYVLLAVVLIYGGTKFQAG